MKIFTIGYEGSNEKLFLACLKRFKISFLADVREKPISRKKGFSKNAMAEMLNSESIKYKNFKELGTSKEMRDALHESNNYDLFFSTYKKIIRNKEEQIHEILKIIKQGHNVALLCFEKDAEKCHRKIIAEEIKKQDGNGMQITHIKSLL
ncbi:MAG: DUF488 domain-containing protein [Desulfobacula sp.]|jgi:uncharacterized protein (DUF488 family)